MQNNKHRIKSQRLLLAHRFYLTQIYPNTAFNFFSYRLNKNVSIQIYYTNSSSASQLLPWKTNNKDCISQPKMPQNWLASSYLLIKHQEYFFISLKMYLLFNFNKILIFLLRSSLSLIYCHLLYLEKHRQNHSRLSIILQINTMAILQSNQMDLQ